LEILPQEPGKACRQTYITYESLEQAFERLKADEYPPKMPSDARYRIEREASQASLKVTA
jgi:hypothetical protein